MVNEDLVCSACGSDHVGSVQRGIDNFWLGLCYECAPPIPKQPDEDDRSAKAEKTRRSIVAKTQVGRYRTKLTPLVLRSEYRPRVKPKPAMPASLWDDDLTGV